MVCVVDMTLSPVTLSSVRGIHTSVPVSYLLLYWNGTVTVVGIHLSQYPLFPVSVRDSGDVGPTTPSFTLPPVSILVPSLTFPLFSVGVSQECKKCKKCKSINPVVVVKSTKSSSKTSSKVSRLWRSAHIFTSRHCVLRVQCLVGLHPLIFCFLLFGVNLLVILRGY